MFSSSDSEEDDCYGNVAQRLQSLKNNYKEQVEEESNQSNSQSFLNESNTELDELLKKHESSLAALRASSPPPRTRRSLRRQKKDQPDNAAQTTSPPKRSNRGRKKANPAENTSTSNTNQAEQINQTVNPTPNQRGRRGRRGVNRGRNTRTAMNNMLPIFNVGNCDEYQDPSEGQSLFSSKPVTDDVVLIDDGADDIDENEELSVKVCWQSLDPFVFKIRKFQKLNLIFQHFSKEKNVPLDNLLFTYKDSIIRPDDTPDSIDYSIAKFIDGGIVNKSISALRNETKTHKNGIKIKFQCENVKKPFETVIELNEKLQLAMTKCAESVEQPLDKLRFVFDGDVIYGKNTPNDLQFEGDECIDVKIIR